MGDEEGALLELDAARNAFEHLGAAPDLASIDALLGDARKRRWHGLTPREKHVLGPVATGRTNRAIAPELFLSERTVERHISSIFSKLDVASRAETTAYAYDHELV